MDGPDAGWLRFQELLRSADSVVVLGLLDDRHAMAVATELQVTDASLLGALTRHTGGLLLDHGWLRIPGGGAEQLDDVLTLSAADGDPGERLIVGLDVLGGRFAVNGGGIAGALGEVCYWGPDTLEWTPIGGGHSAFLEWAVAGGLSEFYGDMRWDGWADEVRRLGPAEGIAVYPPPFTEQGRDLNSVKRAVVGLSELHTFYADAARQLDSTPSRADFELRFDDR